MLATTERRNPLLRGIIWVWAAAVTPMTGCGGGGSDSTDANTSGASNGGAPSSSFGTGVATGGGDVRTSTRATATGGAMANGGAAMGGAATGTPSASGGNSTAGSRATGGWTSNGGDAPAGAKSTGGWTSNGGNAPAGAKSTGGWTSNGGNAPAGAKSTGGWTSNGGNAPAGSKSTGGSTTAGSRAIGATGGSAGAGSSGVAIGSIVPLYSDPGEAPWSAIVTAKLAHPSVPVIAILNPSDGPGSVKSAGYVSGIAALNAAGIRSIGYVYTSYGARAAATVRADIDRWHTFYPAVDGIFFDEVSNTAGGDGYYRDLSTYVKSLGMTITVANPGTDTSTAYIDAVDVSFIYESAGLPSTAMLTGWKSKYSRSKVGVIPYAASLDTNWVRAARDSVGYVYVTNDDLPNPWDTLPAYFAELLASLE